MPPHAKPSDPSRDQQAKAVRALYSFYRNLVAETRGEPATFGNYHVPCWDGGIDSAGRRHQPVWPKIVDKLRSLQFDVAVYLESCFADLGFVGVPMPNMLLSEQTLSGYETYLDRSTAREALNLRVAKTTFLQAIAHNQVLYQCDESKAASLVVVDGTVPITPLFRYCIASAANDEKAAARFREQALGQLALGFYRYTTGWQTFIPAELMSEADRILTSLLATGGDIDG